MGKNNSRRRYETAVQLLLMIVAVLSTIFAFNSFGLELFRVSTSTFIRLWASIKPWLCPPYLYLVLNSIIFFIFASSLRSHTIFFSPPSHEASATDYFIEAPLVFQSFDVEFSTSPEAVGFVDNTEEMWDTSKEGCGEKSSGKKLLKKSDTWKEAKQASVVDKELRRSETFHRPGFRRDKYVRIVSHDELNRRVEAFICKFNKDMKTQRQD